MVATPDFHDKTPLDHVYVIWVNTSGPRFQLEQRPLSCITKPCPEYIAAFSNSNLGLKTAGPDDLTDKVPSITADDAHLAMLDASATGQPQLHNDQAQKKYCTS